jgi:hypothetical protein
MAAAGSAAVSSFRFQVSSEARFRFPQITHGNFCGRLFLAWLPQARHPAQGQPRFLEKQICPQPRPRPAGEPDLAAGQLAGNPHLGMHLEKTSADLPAANPAGFAGLIFLPVSFRGVRVFRGSQLHNTIVNLRNYALEYPTE